jgi:hypothetical protein
MRPEVLLASWHIAKTLLLKPSPQAENQALQELVQQQAASGAAAADRLAGLKVKYQQLSQKVPAHHVEFTTPQPCFPRVLWTSGTAERAPCYPAGERSQAAMPATS